MPTKHWNSSDHNWTRTQNHLVRKRTLNHLARLASSEFESSCSYLNFRFRACFEQGVPWHSGKHRVWFHSETRTWHDKNIQTETQVCISPHLQADQQCKSFATQVVSLISCDFLLAVLVYMQEQQKCTHKAWHIHIEIVSNDCCRILAWKKHP